MPTLAKMARLFIFLNIFLVLITNTTSSLPQHNSKPKPKQKPHNFEIPISKDTKTGLSYTNVTIGQPPFLTTLVVDIGASDLFLQCDELGYNSTTYTPLLCGSPGCDEPDYQCSVCEGPRRPACTKDSCVWWDVEAKLAITSGPHYLLNDDVMPSPSYTTTSPSAPKFGRTRIICVDEFRPFTKLPYGAKAILGLATNRSATSFVKSLVSSHKLPLKVALCLPSKPDRTGFGAAYLGGGPYERDGKDVTGLLVSTPLSIIEPYGYEIQLEDVQVNGKKLIFDQGLAYPWESALINSALIPYTRLDTTIYKPLVKAFAGKAKKRKAVAPFTDCFSYKSFGGKSLLAKEVPVITLVLGGGVKWHIYGPNSLVRVKKTVVCLAFVNAGKDTGYMGRPIEIGSYQMEDNLVEFDLEASMFSVTSSLLRHNTSCTRPL